MQGRGFASSSGAETEGASWFDWKYFTRTRVNYRGPRLHRRHDAANVVPDASGLKANGKHHSAPS